MGTADIICFGFFIFLALLTVLSGKEALPLLILVAKPDVMRISFDDTFAGQEFISTSNTLGDWVHRLQELGFSLLGIKVEKLPLWGRAQRAVAFGSKQAEIYASIVLHKNGSPASLYLYTPFQDGGMVFTRNFASAPEVEGERVSVKNIPTQNFKELLDSHEHRLSIFKERGLVPSAGFSQQARIEATRAFYTSEYVRRSPQYLVSPNVLGFFISLLLLLVTACWLVASSL